MSGLTWRLSSGARCPWTETSGTGSPPNSPSSTLCWSQRLNTWRVQQVSPRQRLAGTPEDLLGWTGLLGYILPHPAGKPFKTPDQRDTKGGQDGAWHRWEQRQSPVLLRDTAAVAELELRDRKLLPRAAVHGGSSLPSPPGAREQDQETELRNRRPARGVASTEQGSLSPLASRERHSGTLVEVWGSQWNPAESQSWQRSQPPLWNKGPVSSKKDGPG
ncbi:uncharacterized protein LOC107155791 isoform X3 [Marmota marmota marmota]|uniref:uncharacterized protein LOC107155791 isoform X3 n=1 Tax=Marmota marmota marmota TaxID=9994 RepID=UPI000762AC06|nr:uncharacterized protein LOC107155791 isoform X3 [Marmota marmota marmota]